MEKKSIKLVLVIADGELGGGTNHVLSLAKSIDKNKFEVFVICPKGYLSKELTSVRNVEVKNISFASKFDLTSILSLKKELEKIQAAGNPFSPMIVHAHGPRACLFVSMAAPSAAKKIYTEHLHQKSYHLKNPINNFVQKQLLKFSLKSYDLVFAVSSAVREYYLKKSFVRQGKIIVVPNWIDLNKFSYTEKKIRSDNKTPIIGTIGTLNKEKGQADLIRAFVKVKSKFPFSRLEIVGDGPERDNLSALIRELKLSKNVFLLGRKTNTFECLKKWDLFVLPSRSETFGLVLLEAMATGVPVIASATGGIVDIIESEKEGLLVEDGRIDNLSAAMIKIIEHPADSARYKRAGFEKVKQFELSKIIKKIEEIYLLLVG